MDDAETIRSWRNDSNVIKYQRNSTEIELDDHMEWFNSRIKRLRIEPFDAFLKDDQLLGFVRIDLHDTREWFISIILSPTSRGKGYGSQILYMFLQSLDTVQNVATIYAEIHKSNYPSIRIFEKCGFEYDGEIDNFFLRYALLYK